MKSFVVFFICLLAINASAQVKTLKEFYPSGKLKSISHEGLFNGCNMKLGTDSIFYESGRLMTTSHYDNRKDKKDVGCHTTWTTEITKAYYPHGKIKSISQKKYSYEGSPCDCGVWIYYNPKGRITKKISRVNCYNQKPCVE